MGTVKKFFSSSSWESSYFGGFSQLLWDMPELSLPRGFDIVVRDRSEYMTWYTQRKLLAVFLNKIHAYELSNNLINRVNITVNNGAYSTNRVYTFDKESVKACVNSLIKIDKELASMFIKYSNMLSNSTITYTEPVKEGEEFDGDARTFLSKKLEDIVPIKKITSYGNYSSSSKNYEDLKGSVTFSVESEAEVEHVYTHDETVLAEKLISMLDVSFEQDETKITNLRTGKIDIPKIAEAIAGNHMINFRKEFHDRTKPFSVCILNDESGSMDHYNFRKHQHSVTKILYKAFSQIMDPRDIYVYGHTGNDAPNIHVYNDKYNQIFDKAYPRQKHRRFEENYDGPVIDCIYDKIREYTDKNILFIVISDGSPCGSDYGNHEDIEDMKRIVEKCKRDGFVTCGIGFNYTGVKQLYQYSTVISTDKMSLAPQVISMLINNVVKSEFQ